MPRRTLAASLVAAVAVSVSGVAETRGGRLASARGPVTKSGDPSAPPSRRTSYPSARLLICGAIPFRPAAVHRSRGYERRTNPAARALRTFLRTSADEVGQPRRGWFLLGRRGNVIEFAAGRQPEFGHMTFTRRQGRWTWDGSGSCVPRAFYDGLQAVTWRRDPGGPVATRGTHIPLLVQEEDCASGQDARRRVLRPFVHYGRRAITVTYFIRPLSGYQTCQSVPPTDVTLILDEPLGSRRLRDGATVPPTRR